MRLGISKLRDFYHRIDYAILYNLSRQREKEDKVLNRYFNYGIPRSIGFSFEDIKEATLSFVQSNRTSNNIVEYKYCSSATNANIYSSVYACMIMGLYGVLDKISDFDRKEWIDYFDSFQDKEDGLFRDPVLMNDIFENEDWWGARHLALHMIISYTKLGSRPKYDFKFLEPFYNPRYVNNWLESRDWVNKCDFVGNEVMNHGCLLQYSRDFFGNKYAGVGLKAMLEWLINNIDSSTGLWGVGQFNKPTKLSQAVQCAYHIYPLFFYDGWDIPFKEKIVDQVLSTQNKIGGYGVAINSSACEDIDSIEPLIRLSQSTSYRQEDINRSLWRAFPWILSNMINDGGFVFRLNEPFVYGHPEMSSKANESSMFATWFRTLCLAYLVNYLFKGKYFNIGRIPGYEIA